MKILVIGGLTHLGFNAVRMTNEVFPGVQVDVLDTTSYAARMFNTAQKVEFIKQMLPNVTLLEDGITETAIYESGYTHVFDFSFPPKRTFNHVYDNYPHFELVTAIKRLENIVTMLLPNANVCVVAHYSLYETLDFTWSLKDNRTNIINDTNTESIMLTWKNRAYKNARIYITPDCVGGVDPENSVQFSMASCLENDRSLFIPPSYYNTPTLAVGTDDVLYAIMKDMVTNSASREGGNTIWCNPPSIVNLSDIGIYLVTALNKVVGEEKFHIDHYENREQQYAETMAAGAKNFARSYFAQEYPCMASCDRRINVEGLHVSHYFLQVASSAVLIHQNTR